MSIESIKMSWDVQRLRAKGLQRFKDAQEATIDQAVNELAAGRKVSHWMWWVFPQPPHPKATSFNSRAFALSQWEAEKYVQDDLLFTRLVLCTSLVMQALEDRRSLIDVFGTVDAEKFLSSMRLFAVHSPLFSRVLDEVTKGSSPR